MAEENPGTTTAAAPKPVRRRRWLRIALKCLAVLAVIVVFRVAWLGILVAMGGKPPTLSRETTYVTKPLRPDGTVDYRGALNALSGQGVTPENNAAIPLMQVIGYWECDSPEGQKEKDDAPCVRLLAAVGAKPLPPTERMRTYDHFIKSPAQPAPGAPDPWDEYTDAQRAPWTRDQFPIAYQAVMANNKAIDRIVAASRLPRYHVPRYFGEKDDGDMLGLLLPDVQGLKDAGRYLMARGMLALGQGRSAAAAEDFLACHRLGRLVSQEPVVICWLVGMGLERMGMQGDAALAHYGKRTVEQLSDYRSQLEKLPPRTPLHHTYEGERLIMLSSMTSVLMRRTDLTTLSGNDDEPRGSVFIRLLDADEMLRTGNEAYDDLVAANALPTLAERKVAVKRMAEKWEQRVAASKSSANLLKRAVFGSSRQGARDLGNVIVTLLLPAIGTCVNREEWQAQEEALRNLAIELAIYRASHGAYPMTLEELRPDVMAKVPAALFAGSPLDYERTAEGFVLSEPLASLGRSGVDARRSEIVMPIPPKPADEM